jgi:hypothetical protein
VFHSYEAAALAAVAADWTLSSAAVFRMLSDVKHLRRRWGS